MIPKANRILFTTRGYNIPPPLDHYQLWKFFYIIILVIFTRPSVVGAVLQTPLSLIN